MSVSKGKKYFYAGISPAGLLRLENEQRDRIKTRYRRIFPAAEIKPVARGVVSRHTTAATPIDPSYFSREKFRISTEETGQRCVVLRNGHVVRLNTRQKRFRHT